MSKWQTITIIVLNDGYSPSAETRKFGLMDHLRGTTEHILS